MQEFVHIMHCALVIMHVLCYDASAKHLIVRYASYSLVLLCTGYDF